MTKPRIVPDRPADYTDWMDRVVRYESEEPPDPERRKIFEERYAELRRKGLPAPPDWVPTDPVDRP